VSLFLREESFLPFFPRGFFSPPPRHLLPRKEVGTLSPWMAPLPGGKTTHIALLSTLEEKGLAREEEKIFSPFFFGFSKRMPPCYRVCSPFMFSPELFPWIREACFFLCSIFLFFLVSPINCLLQNFMIFFFLTFFLGRVFFFPPPRAVGPCCFPLEKAFSFPHPPLPLFSQNGFPFPFSSFFFFGFLRFYSLSALLSRFRFPFPSSLFLSSSAGGSLSDEIPSGSLFFIFLP